MDFNYDLNYISISIVPGPIAANGWWYEKLPIAGDFLSMYKKVEAGYNP